MPKVSLLTRVRANTGRGAELIEACRSLLEQVEDEAGTLRFVVNRSKDDSDSFWFSELYADDEAFAAHGASDAMAKAGPTLGPLIAESELILGEPVLGKGLPSS